MCFQMLLVIMSLLLLFPSLQANPEGPHFGGNPIVGAVLTTTLNIGVACAVSADWP
jgi:hypothetical protein